jgi:cysteinyl-tRNA synthetase
MALKFYNTMTRKKEVFKPLEKGVVNIYNCGPTVYNYAHIGNFRTYVFEDIVRRYLEYKGFTVNQIMNITDVGHMTVDEEADGKGEDKIEMMAKKEKKDPWQIAKFYEKAFHEDMRNLNIKPAMTYPKATEYVKEMIKIIEKLIERGHAYESNGSIYYDISSFQGYGKLSGNTIDKLQGGASGRVDDNTDKKHPLDFSLWVNNSKHIMQWDSPWGRGYPGWHIECSAMSMKNLGETLDIHSGGEDNIFPHHECEIAQSEGATGKKFVRYWLHSRHLLVNGEKMSKSKGNFFTLRDLLEKGHDPRAVRYLLLSGHYRIKLNFTEKGLVSAAETLKRLDGFISALKEIKGKTKPNPGVKKLVEKVKKDFEKAMDDDLNIALALSKIFDFVREVNKIVSEGIGNSDAKLVHETMMKFDTVMGMSLDKIKTAVGERVKIKDSVFTIHWQGVKSRIDLERLIKKREVHRKEKEWKEADKIRDELEKMGYVLEDADTGIRIKKA